MLGLTGGKAQGRVWFVTALLLSTSGQCMAAAKGHCRVLGAISKGISSRDKGAIIPLNSALVGPHLECCAQCWACDIKRMRTGRESPEKGCKGEPRMRKGWNVRRG